MTARGTWTHSLCKIVNVLAFFVHSAVVPHPRGTTRGEVIDDVRARLAVEGGSQLQILAAQARGLREAPARERLIRATLRAETMAALNAVLRSQHITRVTSV